jgi:predicted 3-demethylubiquinone-9 3-methyltransferase (glyoxalase superfamily)
MCIDSNVKHEFTFTPSFSLFISCNTEEEINRHYENLTPKALATITGILFRKHLLLIKIIETVE